LKEVSAAKIRVAEGFSTRARETAELTGGDYESNVRQLAHEKKLMEAAGLLNMNEGGETVGHSVQKIDPSTGKTDETLDDERDSGEE
jgi:capsid protein